MKNYFIVGALVIVSIIGIWLLAASSDKQASQNNEPAQTPQTPETYDPSSASTDTVAYDSAYNPSLALSYPIDWHITEGAENSSQQQLVTFESPKDANNFYFCLDLTEVGGTSDLNLDTKNADIASVEPFSADGVGKNLSSVIFTVGDNPNFLWSLVDNAPTINQMKFSNQISNPNGRRLQTLGRLNCREDTQPDITLDELTDSKVFNQAVKILSTLTY